MIGLHSITKRKLTNFAQMWYVWSPVVCVIKKCQLSN